MSPRRRPKSSFLWLQSPLSLVRHGVRWRYFLWAGLGLAAFLLLLLLHSFFPVSTTPQRPPDAVPERPLRSPCPSCRALSR